VNGTSVLVVECDPEDDIRVKIFHFLMDEVKHLFVVKRIRAAFVDIEGGDALAVFCLKQMKTVNRKPGFDGSRYLLQLFENLPVRFVLRVRRIRVD